MTRPEDMESASSGGRAEAEAKALARSFFNHFWLAQGFMEAPEWDDYWARDTEGERQAKAWEYAMQRVLEESRDSAKLADVLAVFGDAHSLSTGNASKSMQEPNNPAVSVPEREGLTPEQIERLRARMRDMFASRTTGAMPDFDALCDTALIEARRVRREVDEREARQNRGLS